jgi:hypothetical protein
MRICVRWYRAIGIMAAMAALAVFAARPASASASAAEGHFDRTLTVNGPVDLDVQTGSGDINIRTGDAGRVEIHGKIRADGWHILGGDNTARVHEIETNPPIQQDGNTIRIGHIEDHDLMRNISISYEIVVPKDTKVRSKSGSGDEQIEGVGGPVDASSGSGNLKLREIGGEVRASTGSGDVELNNVHGNARTSSGSGSIRAMGIGGGLVASTGSGDVRLEQTAAGDVEVSSGSGDVELNHVKGALRVETGSGNIEADGEPTAQWRLHTGSGDLTVKLPSAAAFDVAAHTSGGSIESSHEIALAGKINPHELHGKVHGGGFLVDLNTSSGTIHID